MEEYWKPLFGPPAVVKMDPAGAFTIEMVDVYLLKNKIFGDLIPAEAHWKLSLVERAFQTTKSVMDKLALEFPEMESREVFFRALWAQNARDQYLGFSPLQHVLGRSPNEQGHLHNYGCDDIPTITEHGISAEFGEDMKAMKTAEETFLEEQYKHRIARANASGGRPVKTCKPGDLVFYWRKQVGGHGSEMNNQGFKKGGFIGPARVLTVETKLRDDGTREPSETYGYSVEQDCSK